MRGQGGEARAVHVQPAERPLLCERCVDGAALGHVTSGCNPALVTSGCHAPAPTPPTPPTPSPPAFDGVVRNGTDGTAYLIPPYTCNHASTIEVLPDGTLCVAWFSGAHEEADKCAIVLATLPFGSTQWSKAATLSQQEGYSNQNLCSSTTKLQSCCGSTTGTRPRRRVQERDL